MNGEIAPPRADFREDDDRDYRSRPSLPQKLAAPTTHKRVGPTFRQPPRPSVDDGPGESAVSSDEIPEDLGIGLLNDLGSLLKTRKGLDDLGSSLDGRPAEDRAAEETRRLARTLKQLRDEGVVDVQILAISRGQIRRLSLADGKTLDVALGPHQRSSLCAASHQKVIVVDADLSPEIRVEEILGTLADEIEIIALENDVAVRRGGVLDFLRRSSAQLFRR